MTDRDTKTLNGLRALFQEITGTKNGADLWNWLDEIHEHIKKEEWTVADAREAVRRRREVFVAPLALEKSFAVEKEHSDND
jgi:hypothetical protein